MAEHSSVLEARGPTLKPAHLYLLDPVSLEKVTQAVVD